MIERQEAEEVEEEVTLALTVLSPEDQKRLEVQNSRLVTPFKASLLERDAQKHWDLFYKRNETRFFKDRHWTLREFSELLNNYTNERRNLLEIGCGVGNFIFPLIQEKLNFYIIACDLSAKAIDMVKQNVLYDEENIKAFHCDITSKSSIFDNVEANSIDIVTLIFVLSAIHPEKFITTLETIRKLLKPGGILLFRDYGLYDMAQLRFKAGHKISDNFYMRQDGTRSYYFSTEYLSDILTKAGYSIISNSYIHRRTVNKKENVDVPRIFVQLKAVKTEQF